MKREQYESAREQALEYFKKAGIALTPEEIERFEVADFGLGNWREVGLNLVTYVNTSRCCAKEMVLLPGQTCPEHTHRPFGSYPGKEETFRCRWGEVYVYVQGPATENIHAAVPRTGKDSYTVFHEIVLRPGQQYTLQPDTLHWFQAGPQGAVISEFSTTSYDEYDIFTDPNIQRLPTVE